MNNRLKLEKSAPDMYELLDKVKTEFNSQYSWNKQNEQMQEIINNIEQLLNQIDKGE